MPTQRVGHTDEPARIRTRLDPTKAKKKPASDVIYYEAPSHAAESKVWQPPPHRTKHILDVDIDRLADQLAGNTLEPIRAWKTEKRTNADQTGNWAWQQQPLDTEQEKPKAKSTEPQIKAQPQQTTLPPPLKTFACFGRLPTELRLKIWKYARPDPRIVRISWSKDPLDPLSGTEDLPWFQDIRRPKYSETPIPAMLHVCAESRQVALGWYKLGLHSKPSKPRVYFDFDSDYLYVGCNECGVCFCHDCTNRINFEDCYAIKRVLVHWAPRRTTPFFSLHLDLRGVKEVLLFNPSTDPLNPDTELAHLQETTKPFDWQKGRSLYDIFLEDKPKLDQYYMDSLRIHQAEAKDPGPLHPTKIARVELIVTAAKTKISGFMGDKFENAIDFSLHPRSV